MSSQPRWLHISPSSCGRLQQLLDGRSLTGARVGGLVTVVHEALHAYGWKNEARTNCYAVQLSSFVAVKLGMPKAKGGRVAKLAVNHTRSRAPAKYWNGSSCRDGGKWDLLTAKTLR